MPANTNPLDPFGVWDKLGSIFGKAADAIPNPVGDALSPLVKLFTVLTDRGILIRTATVMFGIVLIAIGVFMFAREPIMKVATTAAKAVPL